MGVSPTANFTKEMNMQTKRYLMIVTLASAAALSASAFAGAHHGRENDAVAELAKAKVTLTDAVGTAEKHVQGRAARAELESGKTGPVYEIEIVANDKVFDVRIDAADGKVLSSQEDRHDRHEHRKDMK